MLWGSAFDQLQNACRKRHKTQLPSTDDEDELLLLLHLHLLNNNLPQERTHD